MNLFFDLGGGGTPELCLRKSDPWVTKPLKTRNTLLCTRIRRDSNGLARERDLDFPVRQDHAGTLLGSNKSEVCTQRRHEPASGACGSSTSTSPSWGSSCRVLSMRSR